jgi:hypothetical protein
MSKVFSFLPDGAGGSGSSEEVGRFVISTPSALDPNEEYAKIGGEQTLIEVADAPDLDALGVYNVAKTATGVTLNGMVNEVITGMGNIVSEVIINCNGRNFLYTLDPATDRVDVAYTDNLNLTGWITFIDQEFTGDTSLSVGRSEMIFDGNNRLMLKQEGRYKVINTETLTDLTGWLLFSALPSHVFQSVTFNKKSQVWTAIRVNDEAAGMTFNVYETEKYNNIFTLKSSNFVEVLSTENPTSGYKLLGYISSYINGKYYFKTYDLTFSTYKIYSLTEENWEITEEHSGTITNTGFPFVEAAVSITSKGSKVIPISAASGVIQTLVQEADSNIWIEKSTSVPVTINSSLVLPVEGDTYIIMHSSTGANISITYDLFDNVSTLTSGGTGRYDGNSGFALLPNNQFVVSDITNVLDTTRLTIFDYTITDILKIPHFIEETSANYMRIT